MNSIPDTDEFLPEQDIDNQPLDNQYLDNQDIDNLDIDNDALFEHVRIEVDKNQSPIRIDKFLHDRLGKSSRSRIQDGLDKGYILVNQQNAKHSYKIRPADLITISFPTPIRDTDIKPQDISLDIVYEDEHVLVVNKAAGMVVHPAHNNWDGTLVNALVYRFNNNQLPTSQNGLARPGLVHRIDKDTSGLLVIAKTEDAMRHLATQFFDHSIQRTYRAIVWGLPEPANGIINQPLMRSPNDRRVIVVAGPDQHGRHAVSHYQTLEHLRYVSYVECKLETGRTHQIRAHFRHLGHPIFADEMYGGTRILKGTVFNKYKAFVENCFKLMPRQALHAYTLGFVHPHTGENMHFEAPLPTDFQQVLDKWRHYLAHQ